MGPPSKKPGRSDVSRADRAADYEYKKRFYQSEAVARDYDQHRFEGSWRQRRNRRKWRAILRALALAPEVGRVLDLPCGTGRFTGDLAREGYEVVAADIAGPMMEVAAERLAGTPRFHGFLRADAERLPLSDDAVDCVVSIRFLFHVDPVVRVGMLREMARVSRRWLVLDFRHKQSYRYWMLRLRHLLGFARDQLAPQVSRAELERELSVAGVRIIRVFPVAWFFSDKWVVLCEKPSPA